MPLQPGSLGKTEYFMPLSTGFDYTPRQELKDFELRPEILQALTDRLQELEKYQQRPADSRDVQAV